MHTHSPVPTIETPPAESLRHWLEHYRRVFVLTGAGCSTHSGIPDYRDREGAWKRTPPVMFQAFTADQAVYRRYWARSSLGWPRFAQAQPNPAHHALAALEHAGRINTLVTQNVDGLHQRAGSDQVIDLHGRLDAVVCLHCARRSTRHQVQTLIQARNPDWHAEWIGIAPDGDADIDSAAIAQFIAPHCEHCGGLLKPDVVFFGEHVPATRVRQAHDALQASDAMLVIGSSLMVYSGFRFARMAAAANIPLAILNQGRTRADDLAGLRLDADVGSTLAAVAGIGHALHRPA